MKSYKSLISILLALPLAFAASITLATPSYTVYEIFNATNCVLVKDGPFQYKKISADAVKDLKSYVALNQQPGTKPYPSDIPLDRAAPGYYTQTGLTSDTTEFLLGTSPTTLLIKEHMNGVIPPILYVIGQDIGETGNVTYTTMNHLPAACQ